MYEEFRYQKYAEKTAQVTPPLVHFFLAVKALVQFYLAVKAIERIFFKKKSVKPD